MWILILILVEYIQSNKISGTYILAFHRISWLRSRTLLDSRQGLCNFFGTIRPSSSNLTPEEDNLCWASIIESWWLSLILRPLMIVSKIKKKFIVLCKKVIITLTVRYNNTGIYLTICKHQHIKTNKQQQINLISVRSINIMIRA